MADARLNVLVNLQDAFYRAAPLREALARLGRTVRVRRRSHDDPAAFARDLAWADALLMWSTPVLTPDLLDRAPRLRFVGQIDMRQDAARTLLARGLPVALVRRGWYEAVAEMALALILATLRRTSDYHAAMRRGDELWYAWPAFPGEIHPAERVLAGRPVGLVGFGAIGRRVAELLGPFGCRLRYYDPFVPPEAGQVRGARRAGLLDLMRRSDVVVVAAASNAGSRHLIGRRELAALRPGSVLVNVARAAIVDTDALVARLRKGDLFAALDVFDAEPLPKDSPLRRLPNVYLTPHRAGGIFHSLQVILHQLIDNLEAFRSGRPLPDGLTEEMIPALDG